MTTDLEPEFGTVDAEGTLSDDLMTIINSNQF